MSDEQVRVFDDGADVLAALAGLEGPWLDQWQKDLNLRARDADFVAVVDLESVCTETDAEQHQSHRLALKVRRVLRGEAVKEVSLASRQGAPGFAMLEQNLARLEQGPLVAYVKWVQADKGGRTSHFHLSPAQQQIVEETELALTARDTRTVVTEHED